MRRVALITFGAALIALDVLWLFLIDPSPSLPQDWPIAAVALYFAVLGVAIVYSGARPPAPTPSETPIRTTTLADRCIRPGLFVLFVGVLTYLVFVPSAASPDAKVRLILLEFDGYQHHLARLCGTQPLQTGELSFDQTGIPGKTSISPKAPSLKVDVSVAVPEPDMLLLTVSLPEITAEGVYLLWGSDLIPAGATLRSKGRCERGTVFWTRLESTIPEERLHAALTAGIR